MAELENTLNELQLTLKQRCPNFAPAIFPTLYTPKLLEQLVKSNEHKETIKPFLRSNNFEHDHFIFKTSFSHNTRIINIETIQNSSKLDKTLNDLESLLKLITIGKTNQLSELIDRFLILNNHDITHTQGSQMLYEVVHIAYSIKVLISNINGIKVKLLGHTLPLTPTADVYDILTQAMASSDDNTSAIVTAADHSTTATATATAIPLTNSASSASVSTSKTKKKAASMTNSSLATNEMQGDDAVVNDEEADDEDINISTTNSNQSNKKRKRRRGKG